MFTRAKRGFSAGTGKPVFKQAPEDWDEATAPECAKCGDPYNPKRAEKGYACCLLCGEPAKEYALVPTHKGAYTPVTAGTKLSDLSGDKSGHGGF